VCVCVCPESRRKTNTTVLVKKKKSTEFIVTNVQIITVTDML